MRSNEEIVEILNNNLEKSGMSMSEYARQVGVAKSAMSRYLNGKRPVPLNNIEDYTKPLKLDVEYVLGFNEVKRSPLESYNFYPTAISAGLPDHVAGISESEQIDVPDSIMGKHAGQRDIFITRVNGNSMNRIIPDDSLIGVKPIEFHQLKDGDVVVYSDDGDYSVKRFYRNGDDLIFKPDSTDARFYDYVTNVENDNLKIHGKVVVYIVELD